MYELCESSHFRCFLHAVENDKEKLLFLIMNIIRMMTMTASRRFT